MIGQVGHRRSGTVQDVAKERHLDWHTAKELDKHYMRAQLAKAGMPGPKTIGIGEISIRNGRTCRIVVADLTRGRPIWFGGQDRSKASMAQFYASLGPKKAQGTRMAVIDMSAAFEKATQTHAPMAVIGVGKVAGFSLHTGVVTWAGQREKLERLRRYVSRPAVSENPPSLTPYGNV